MDPCMHNGDCLTPFSSVTFSVSVSSNVDLMPNSETMACEGSPGDGNEPSDPMQYISAKS